MTDIPESKFDIAKGKTLAERIELLELFCYGRRYAVGNTLTIFKADGATPGVRIALKPEGEGVGK